MRIALLCNDRVALPALDYLLSTGLLVAVGMPDRSSEVQMLVQMRCKNAGVPFSIFSKSALAESLQEWLKEIRADVVLVKTFPFLVPASVLTVPKFGFVNFHYAPLPAFRGPNPLFWMIRNRVPTGGVTVHEMSESFDAGAILLEQAVPINASINFGILYTQLAYAGMQLTAQFINKLLAGELEKKEQDHSKANWYSRPTPSDLVIHWQTMDAEEITALVRACNPWNKGAATSYKGWTFGITYASVANRQVNEPAAAAGTILSIDPVAGFCVASKDGKKVVAEVVYCEEGFYPGYCISAFGLQINQQLS